MTTQRHGSALFQALLFFGLVGCGGAEETADAADRSREQTPSDAAPAGQTPTDELGSGGAPELWGTDTGVDYEDPPLGGDASATLDAADRDPSAPDADAAPEPVDPEAGPDELAMGSEESSSDLTTSAPFQRRPASECAGNVVQPVYITPKGYKGADRSAKLLKVLEVTQQKWSNAGASFALASPIKYESKHTANWFRKHGQDQSAADRYRWFDNAKQDLIERLELDFAHAVYVVFLEVKTRDDALGRSELDAHLSQFDFDDSTSLIHHYNGAWGAGVVSHELSHAFGTGDLTEKQCLSYKGQWAKPAVCSTLLWPKLRFSNSEFREMFCDDKDYHFFPRTCQSTFPKRDRVCPDFNPRTD